MNLTADAGTLRLREVNFAFDPLFSGAIFLRDPAVKALASCLGMVSRGPVFTGEAKREQTQEKAI